MEIVKQVVEKYKSFDGKIFDTEYECKVYEKRELLTKVYIIFPISCGIAGVSRWMEAYSTYEKALDSLKNVDKKKYEIKQLYIDEIER